MQGWAIGMMLVLFTFAACSKTEDEIVQQPEKETPQLPSVEEDPAETKSDTVEIKIGHSISVTEEQLVQTRADFSSRDLIGVQVDHLKKDDNFWKESYACGVFDDLDKLVFKFVKGNRYLIQMTYFPNAKDIVYNYPDGTYGSPFSKLYALTSYKVNEPVYSVGPDGGSAYGDMGPGLSVMDGCYQPTADRATQSFSIGTTPRYSGEIEEIMIEEGTQITVPLYLCMMGITLDVDNFTEGKLTMNWAKTYMPDWVVTPDDSHSIQYQIPYNYLYKADGTHYYDGFDVGEKIQLFYTNAKGEKYLLATKFLPYKMGVNYVFKFSLSEREDGSIGIQMPTDEAMQDEETTFD